MKKECRFLGCNSEASTAIGEKDIPVCEHHRLAVIEYGQAFIMKSNSKKAQNNARSKS